MLMKLKNISKSFGANSVLNKININISKKQCYGIIGPNGAGKVHYLKLLQVIYYKMREIFILKTIILIN